MTRALQVLLLSAAAVAGGVVVSKALTGFPNSSPLNAEGVFAVAFVLLVLLRTSSEAHTESEESQLIAPLFGLLLIAATFWGIQNMTFLCDDYFVVLDAVRGRGAHFIDTLISDKGDVYFRPAAYSTLWLAAKGLGTNAALWHVHHLVLHLLNCGLLYLLAVQLGLAAPWAAVAMVLFGVHGARPESVVWIAGYWELVSLALVLATLILFLHSRHAHRRIAYAGSLICCIAALWSKESAYVLPGLIFLLPLAKDSLRSRLTRMAPYALITAVAFVHRWIALGGIGGYVTGGRAEAGAISIVRIAKLLLFRLWATLVFPINWSVEPGPVVALTMALALAGLLFASRSSLNRNFTVFCIGATLASALPASSQLLLGPDLQKGRLLYLPSVGMCLLIAALIRGIPQSRIRLATAFACVLFSVAVLRHNLGIWQGVSKVMAVTYSQVGRLTKDGPRNVTTIGIPGSIRGVYFFMNGFTACLDMANGGFFESEMLPAGTEPTNRSDRTILIWKGEQAGLTKLTPE